MKNVKIIMISLGCDKNLVDSEEMLGALSENGYTLTDDKAEADVAIVNTCCFINDAKEESIQELLSMAEWKSEKEGRFLIAAGCMAQRYASEIQKEIPEVDSIIGTTATDKVAEAVGSLFENGGRRKFIEDADRVMELKDRVSVTLPYVSYLKIAEGCDKRCTYCVVPQIRGHYRSFPIEDLLNRAKKLIDKGVRELILVAQETTLYGKDLYGKKSLGELIRQISEIDGIEWIRIMYCYPEEIDDDLIQVIKENEKVCHYLDMPIQHSADTVLKRMGRFTTESNLREVIMKLRENIPDICLRTTVITGFPGETEEEFESLLDFIDEIEFDRLGAFTYSIEEDTPAALMKGQISEKTKEERLGEIMSLQQEIAYEKAKSRIGSVLKVIVEGNIPEDGIYVSRTYLDAPDVDGYLFFESEREFLSGDFVNVLVTDSNNYDLIGEIYESSK